MIFTPDELTQKERYKLATGSILPRPIAWVSTMDKAGQLNLAPFSYFTPVCTAPLTLLFCPGWSSARNRRKDTWLNVLEVPEFVINIVDEETAVFMNRSAAEVERDVDEFAFAGVTPVPSEAINVPRVQEAPISFECTLQQIVTINEGPGGGATIFGEVQRIHIRDDVYDDGYINLEMLKPIGRLAGSNYARMTDLFSIERTTP